MGKFIKMMKKYFLAIVLSAMCCGLFFVVHTHAQTPTLKQKTMQIPTIKGVLAKVNTTIRDPRAGLSCFGMGCNCSRMACFDGTLKWANTYVNTDNRLITDRAYLREISSKFVRIMKRTKGQGQSDWSKWREVSPPIGGAANTGTFSVKSSMQQPYQRYQFLVRPIVTRGVTSVPATSGEVVFIPNN